MAAKKDAPADPTLGGAIPDPNDQSPRARFLRNEIDWQELSMLERDTAGRETVKPDAKP